MPELMTIIEQWCNQSAKNAWQDILAGVAIFFRTTSFISEFLWGVGRSLRVELLNQ